MLTQSYVHGASTTPLIGETIGQNFDRAVETWATREALVVVHQDIRWTYADLGEQVDTCAAGFVAMGLEPGDRVGIWSPNNSEWLVTQFATAKAGLVLVNINPAYRISELEYALNKVGVKMLIMASTFKTSDYVAMIREIAPELEQSEAGNLASQRLPHLKSVVLIGGEKVAGTYEFPEIAAAANEDSRERIEELSEILQFDDRINVQFTSGTTGFPKGATLTHFNILNNGFFVGEAMKLTTEDRLCVPVPLYHCFGMVLGNLACLTHGAAIIYPDEAFEPLSVLKTVEAEKCTALHGVPTMFIAELEHPEFLNFDLATLRTGIMAGSPCPVEVMKRVIAEMNMDEVTIAYGMTETSPVSFQSSTDDPLDRRVSTVGQIMPHVEVKIIDEHGQIVPPGETGELLTRGYSVMQGYWGDPDQSAQAIDIAGWMHTGDLATIDEEGYGNIVGRVKDMVIRGGENVYPREIEEYLYGIESVQDVQVFGVPDEKYGEELCAWITLNDGANLTEDAVKDFCKGQIAHYKIPRYVKFVEEFPMTVTGKVQKFVMREAMIKELGLSESETA
ncbi:MAG: AMP-binding protein [Alphaproteobacteria bacterium]|mgnify:CR=1 FL=1|jgi:fatty-acyl-CoA synthase|nr:AMP-binding protein [Alphaproteobacteria bacterium]MBT4082680.1 AMP-binding protein [Alphaproteobacteria bacterium]MBT4543658.1 AMP-binding protein [Alphaproteobacteria bacterium]MBT7744426.1 AMP-binding protein [Alphaproteobacteria bacterium]